MVENKKERRGRKKGSTNLKYSNGVAINKFGVKFTQSEIQDLRRSSMKLNAKWKRRRQYVEKTRPETLLHNEDDPVFNITRKSASLRNFRTKQEFDAYLNSVKYFNSKDYIDKRITIYKENYKTAIKKVFNSRGDKIVDAINKMTNKQFEKLITSKQIENINYVYFDPENNKLNHILEQIVEGYEEDGDDVDLEDIF